MIRMAEGNSKAIKGIVEGVLKDWKKKKVFKKDAVEKNWKKVVGKKASQHTRVSSMRSGRLVVESDESGWIYQLSLKKQEILGELEKALAKEDIGITEIQFRIGTFGQGDVNGKKEGKPKKKTGKRNKG